MWNLRFLRRWERLYAAHTVSDVTPYSVIDIYRYFRGTYWLYLEARYMLTACLFASLFDPEDGGQSIPPKRRLNIHQTTGRHISECNSPSDMHSLLGLSYTNLPSPFGFVITAHAKGEQFCTACRLSPTPKLMYNLAVKTDCPHLWNVIPSLSTNLNLELYLMTSICEIMY
jgi:hypothetical protein